MAYKTAGSLRAVEYIEETDYGATPATGTYRFLGIPSKVDHGDGRAIHKMANDGVRNGFAVYGKRKSGLSVEVPLYAENSSNYAISDILKMALGTASGPRADIPSYTIYVQAAPDQHYIYRGCKVDTMTIDASDIGAPIRATLSFCCATSSQSTETRPAAPAPATIPPLYPIVHASYAKMGNILIPAKSYKLTVGNHLAKEPGIVGTEAWEAGIMSYPADALSVGASYTVASTSSYWDNLKLWSADAFDIIQELGAYTLTIAGCMLSGEDLPTRSQSAYDETIAITASNLTWGVE